jgi:hypothetical protein
MLPLHQIIDTDTLANLTAGGTDFIRTKDGKVKGIAIRRDLNPEAPKIVLVGYGEKRQNRARLYVEQAIAVPAFVKRATDSWEYIGDYCAVNYSESKSIVKKYVEKYEKHPELEFYRTPNSVAGVLWLEPVTTQTVTVVGGGFPDSKTRKEIEQAAVSHVSKELKRRGYEIEDRQPENLGYDLLASANDHQLFVEVKGTDATAPRFYLTRNEWTVGQRESNWRLFLVTSARTAPTRLEYTAAEIEACFTRAPLSWECTAK